MKLITYADQNVYQKRISDTLAVQAAMTQNSGETLLEKSEYNIFHQVFDIEIKFTSRYHDWISEYYIDKLSTTATRIN
jgi:hypothetical protein